MLDDLRAAWRLRSGQAGGRRLAFLTLLVVLAGATDGVGLALLVPLLNALGAAETGDTGGWLALLPRSLPVLLSLFLVVVMLRALIARAQQIVGAELSFDFAVALRGPRLWRHRTRLVVLAAQPARRRFPCAFLDRDRAR